MPTKTAGEDVWWEHTWNPFAGCTPVSDGCHNCYARAWAKRAGRDFDRITPSKTTARAPLNKSWAAGDFVFVCSVSDFFHPDAEAFRSEAVEIMKQRQDLVFLLLTKRVEHMQAWVVEWNRWHATPPGRQPYEHIWLGVTVERARYLFRLKALLTLDWPGKRFMCAGPMLGPLDIRPYLRGLQPRALDWVICEGESTARARPMEPDWPRRLRDDCVDAGVPFFFKQWGEWLPEGQVAASKPNRGHRDCRGNYRTTVSEAGTTCYAMGKGAAGRLLDGRTWDERPGA